MNELKELREKLVNELRGMTNRKLDMNALETLDKLAHTVKCIDTVLEHGEHSEGYHDGGSYYDGGSYARRRDSRGRYMDGDRSWGGSYGSREGMAYEALRRMAGTGTDSEREMARRVLEQIDK